MLTDGPQAFQYYNYDCIIDILISFFVNISSHQPDFDESKLLTTEGDGTIIKSTWTEVIDNFDDMNLQENLLRGIFAYGFEKPSAIQQRAIMPAIKGNVEYIS